MMQETGFSLLLAKLKGLIDLSESEANYLQKGLSTRSFKAKTYLQKLAFTAQEVFFIQNGLARTFHLADGKEVISYLGADGSFVGAFSSFINQKPSLEFVQAIEDCEVLAISYSYLQKLYQENPKWLILGKILAEQFYICMTERYIFSQMKTAKQRYEDFLSQASPKVLQRTPQIYIASYLGITPEALSRIRRELSIS